MQLMTNSRLLQLATGIVRRLTPAIENGRARPDDQPDSRRIGHLLTDPPRNMPVHPRLRVRLESHVVDRPHEYIQNVLPAGTPLHAGAHALRQPGDLRIAEAAH